MTQEEKQLMDTNGHTPLYEDYVSFEIAKLLKEKGFDWTESPFYSEQDRDEWRQNNNYTIPNTSYNPDLPFDSETITLIAPHVSLQMAMTWLREVHNCHICVQALITMDLRGIALSIQKSVVYLCGKTHSEKITLHHQLMKKPLKPQ